MDTDAPCLGSFLDRGTLAIVRLAIFIKAKVNESIDS